MGKWYQVISEWKKLISLWETFIAFFSNSNEFAYFAWKIFLKYKTDYKTEDWPIFYYYHTIIMYFYKLIILFIMVLNEWIFNCTSRVHFEACWDRGDECRVYFLPLSLRAIQSYKRSFLSERTRAVNSHRHYKYASERQFMSIYRDGGGIGELYNE